MSIIKLRSSDGIVFETDVQVAKCSNTIKTMLEDCGIGGEGDDAIVPLPNVNANILDRVLKWANYHKDDPEIDENADSGNKTISTWDAEFLKVDQGTLFELIMAANYLDIKGLLDISATAVANMMKGKTSEEIRKIFNIKNDLIEAAVEEN